MAFENYNINDLGSAVLDELINATDDNFNGVDINNLPASNFILNVAELDIDGNIIGTEKMHITTLASGSFTGVTRGFGGTTAREFSQGALLRLNVEVEVIKDIQTEVLNLGNIKANLSGATFTGKVLFNTGSSEGAEINSETLTGQAFRVNANSLTSGQGVIFDTSSASFSGNLLWARVSNGNATGNAMFCDGHFKQRALNGDKWEMHSGSSSIFKITRDDSLGNGSVKMTSFSNVLMDFNLSNKFLTAPGNEQSAGKLKLAGTGSVDNYLYFQFWNFQETGSASKVLFTGQYGASFPEFNINADKTVFNGRIDVTNSSSSEAFKLNNTSSGRAMNIETTTAGIQVYTNSIYTGTGHTSLFSLRADNASSTGTVFRIQNDGSGLSADIPGRIHTNLPTSPTGLSAGELWNNDGVPNIV